MSTGEKLGNLPQLSGWVNLTEAAEILGISRQHAYRRARLAHEGKAGGWKTVCRIGTKPSYVVALSELQDELESSRQ
jgi:hypothetical protein